jgi:hypothetical protein
LIARDGRGTTLDLGPAHHKSVSRSDCLALTRLEVPEAVHLERTIPGIEVPIHIKREILERECSPPVNKPRVCAGHSAQTRRFVRWGGTSVWRSKRIASGGRCCAVRLTHERSLLDCPNHRSLTVAEKRLRRPRCSIWMVRTAAPSPSS